MMPPIPRPGAVFIALSLFGLAACQPAPPPPMQASSADLARVAPAPIPVSPRVEGIYRGDYIARLDPQTSGVFTISLNGNRAEYRFCRHPDCRLSDDELAARALERCNLGSRSGCVVFDRNGRIGQPYRAWKDTDFAPPDPLPPILTLTDPAMLANGRFAAMTPDGQLVVSLRPDGRAYFWDTGDGFHQGTWSLKAGLFCVDSVDQKVAVTCGTLYGADGEHIVGATLDLFPGRFLPVTRLEAVVKVRTPEATPE